MYFKTLDDNGAGMYSKMAWALPRHRMKGVYSPGKWMPTVADLIVCKSGYHLTDEAHLMEWLGPTIYVAEGRGDFVDGIANGDNKSVFAQARLLRKLDTWNAKSARLFAADVAEHVLPSFEARFPYDRRPRNVITVAREFANGLATEGELNAARNDAYAACNAAANAARAAAYAAYVDARVAANAAANAAADAAVCAAATYTTAAADAAYDAVYAAAARSGERRWQTAKLMEYLFPNSG